MSYPAFLIALEASLLSGASISLEDPVTAAFRELAGQSVIFGHQSVGANILEGLQRQARSRGVELRAVELREGEPLPPATLGHSYVAANGDPKAKLAAFEALMRGREGKPPQLALFKLCWADFEPGTDVRVLFDAYVATFDRLAAAFPRTTFVHLTTPLTTVQGGTRALARRLLGRAPYGEVENVRREEFNALLRARYGQGPFFDLARAEAEEPGGGVATHSRGGRATLALAEGNSSDGGHLTPAAQDRVAVALVAALAGVGKGRAGQVP